TRFSCLAERCEDTCCRGLKVELNRADYQALEATMGKAEPEQFSRFIVRTPSPERGQGVDEPYATIAAAPGGTCPLLDPELLCGIQRRYGEAALQTVCAAFPRVFSEVGGRREVSGSLGCPEIARQLLL